MGINDTACIQPKKLDIDRLSIAYWDNDDERVKSLLSEVRNLHGIKLKLGERMSGFKMAIDVKVQNSLDSHDVEIIRIHADPYNTYSNPIIRIDFKPSQLSDYGRYCLFELLHQVFGKSHDRFIRNARIVEMECSIELVNVNFDDVFVTPPRVAYESTLGFEPKSVMLTREGDNRGAEILIYDRNEDLMLEGEKPFKHPVTRIARRCLSVNAAIHDLEEGYEPKNKHIHEIINIFSYAKIYPITERVKQRLLHEFAAAAIRVHGIKGMPKIYSEETLDEAGFNNLIERKPKRLDMDAIAGLFAKAVKALDFLEPTYDDPVVRRQLRSVEPLWRQGARGFKKAI